MKRSFFQAAVVSILLYGCTTWTLTKRLKKKLDGNYTSMLRGILNKSWRHHLTKHQLYGHLPPITKTIKVRWIRLAGDCWRSKDKLLSDVLLCTPSYSRAKAGRPARTNIQQLCEGTGCSPEDLPEAMNDRENWWERVKNIRVGGMTWWWWWYIYIYIYIYIHYLASAVGRIQAIFCFPSCRDRVNYFFASADLFLSFRYHFFLLNLFKKKNTQTYPIRRHILLLLFIVYYLL